MSLLKYVFLPSKLILILLMIAVVLYLIRRWRRFSFIPFVVSALLYITMGSGTISALLLSPLEYKYEALHHPENYPDVRHIVILTAYVADDPEMSLSGKFNSNTLFRIVEAHNIYKHCEGCSIIISGTSNYVKLMHEQLLLLGIPETDIIDDAINGHTVDSAVSVAKLLGKKKIFLVTSAGHMPRAMGVFIKNGLQPVAAPTDYLMPKDFLRASIMPDAFHLYCSDLAVNEYAGILWYKLTDRI